MQQRHAATVERQLVGTWKLVSLSRELLPGGKPAPERPRNGFLNFAPGNRMMAMVVPRDRKAPAEMFPTDQEMIHLFTGLVAYCGRYAVEGDTIVTHVDMSWNQSWTGTRQVRFYTLEGKRLMLKTGPSRNTADGQDSVHTQVWEKVG
jgi:hypothetical protein